MRILLALSGVLLYITATSGQSLNGRITDKADGSPLPGATVYIPDLRSGAVSDANGFYQFKQLPSGKFLIQVKLLGFSGQSRVIDLSATQQADFTLEQSIIEKSEVIVTGSAFTSDNTRMSVPVTAVEKMDILKSGPNNLVQALSAVPGVSSISTGNGIAKPVIRGLGYNRVVVVNEGVRQEGQQWGDEHGLEVDQYSADHIEILKGPSTLQYGSDALGGVINILEPIPAPDGVIRGEALTQYSTNNGLSGNTLMLEGNQNGFIWLGRGSFKSAASFKTPVETVYNSGFEEKSGEIMLGLHKKWGFSHLHFSSWNSDIGLTEGERDSLTGKFVDHDGEIVSDDDLNTRSLVLPKQRVQHRKLSLVNNFIIGKNQLRVQGGWQENRRNEFEESADAASISMKLNTFNYDIRYYPVIGENWESAVGVTGMSQQNENLGEELLIPDYQLNDAGIFATLKRNFNKTTINAGIRYDLRQMELKEMSSDGSVLFEAGDKKFSAFSGSAGITYELKENLTLKANVGRGYRAPNAPELSANGLHEGTFRYEIGNRDLKPETSLQLDAGVLFTDKKIKTSLDLFYNMIDNFIYYENKDGEMIAADGGMYPVYRYIQGNSVLYGGEFTFDIHFVDQLHFDNSFAMVIGENRSSYTPLPFIPPFKSLHELQYDFKDHHSGKFSGVYVRIGVENVLKQDRIDPFETVTEGYVLLNAGAGATLSIGKQKLNLFIAANNLTDREYFNHLSRYKEIGVNGPGRDISFGLQLPFNVK